MRVATEHRAWAKHKASRRRLQAGSESGRSMPCNAPRLACCGTLASKAAAGVIIPLLACSAALLPSGQLRRQLLSSRLRNTNHGIVTEAGTDRADQQIAHLEARGLLLRGR